MFGLMYGWPKTNHPFHLLHDSLSLIKRVKKNKRKPVTKQAFVILCPQSTSYFFFSFSASNKASFTTLQKTLS